jgi:hypothetical protein
VVKKKIIYAILTIFAAIKSAFFSAAFKTGLTEIVCQLSVANAMAKSAAAANENMEAKHKVTALQNAMMMMIITKI